MIHRRTRARVYMAVAVSAVIVLVSAVSVLSVQRLQNATSVERYLQVMEVAEGFDQLRDILGELTEEERLGYIEDPRSVLADGGATFREEFVHIIALDLALASEVIAEIAGEERRAVALAPSRDPDLVPVPEGIGVMRENVGIVIRQLAAPDEIRPPLETLFNGILIIPEQMLDDLSRVIEELNGMTPGSDNRREFMANPRGYLEAQGIPLGSEIVEVIGTDFQILGDEQPEVLGEGEVAPGLTYVAECIVVIANDLVCALQPTL
ncbi:MAG: hypothetical protein JSW65_04835 [Candidatus Bipolaricaulota bacterium]|nr:MAG: hypothetical protein JSW65_04835 [Candidatus Bipolaricaulota bacterium]